VTNSYININRLIKQKSAIQETISFFEERSKLSRSRFEIGTAGKNDYLQSQIDLNVQRNNEINLTNNIALAKMDLNQLLARDPNTPFEVQDIIVPETLPTQAEVMEAIESINPQITLLRYNQQILEQNALEIKALQKVRLILIIITVVQDSTYSLKIMDPRRDSASPCPCLPGRLPINKLRSMHLIIKTRGFK